MFFRSFKIFFVRFRYPVSLPEDIGKDLGLEIDNHMSFQEFINKLTDPRLRPSTLSRLMSREEAEKKFNRALKKESFLQQSLFFYHFNGSWMGFTLDFDENSRLRRLYLMHRDLKKKHEISISP